MVIICDWDAFMIDLFLVQIAEQGYVEIVDVFLVVFL